MTAKFKVGARVSWNSEAGRVSGRTIRVLVKAILYKDYMHHASRDNPQYEIKSDKTNHIAMHKGTAGVEENAYLKLQEILSIMRPLNHIEGGSHAEVRL
ncbi:MAG: DUF2945 domain-containing protein [Gammaproteobacteria bacterium]